MPILDNGSWPDALRLLAAALPAGPAIIVLDELPWLAEQDEHFDGVLQTTWDRLLRQRPLLLLMLGSDLHMMARLTAYDRPFFGRADNLVLGPLTVADTAKSLALDPPDAIDAQLVSGGLPGILASWPAGVPALPFLAAECEDPSAPVFSVPESSMLAEFPMPDLSRRVLAAIGSGERTQANIAAAAGNRSEPVSSGSLSPLLRQLAMLRDAQNLARRGRPGPAYQLIERRWSAWRGRAVEPLIRDALELALADGALPSPTAAIVGGWWNRRFAPEVDLVGADRAPSPTTSSLLVR
ncbi:hypothetical protein JQS43_07385 [Natronosporangium hydrolyticum]|uniref:ATP-binding protein n=1 Tax=Natronosporangium hydrolyticum TaxID=2811111 RepID=A0A895YQ56_9ACTN|nr:hypothetical protein [Natronosporangium hydrolyticum]QSB16118.1 hypothetical protein JQS43_07385 [Natronosporangium hydrolyticum]